MDQQTSWIKSKKAQQKRNGSFQGAEYSFGSIIAISKLMAENTILAAFGALEKLQIRKLTSLGRTERSKIQQLPHPEDLQLKALANPPMLQQLYFAACLAFSVAFTIESAASE